MNRLLQFQEFRLDPGTGRLWQSDKPKDLTPKAFALLHYLASHPQQLVAKEQLMNQIWGDSFVGEAVLKVAIAELRKVLGDDPKEPQFIETVHRRGYRFIGEATADQAPKLVGREDSLLQLKQAWAKAMNGTRQTVFLTGEPGIGKSTLMNTFLESMPGHVWIARGQCVQQYGNSEPYLPVLDAFGRLARTSGMEEFVATFRRHAPTWLSQMPALVSDQERQQLAREVLGATRERMVREMAEAVETLSVNRPLILALEDLHWADLSTVDLLSALSWRNVPARFLLIGTYRPVEATLMDHPIKSLKQDLVVQDLAVELSLDLLSEAEVKQAVTQRCPEHDFPPEIYSWLYQRTSGNPLFLINVLDFSTHDYEDRRMLRATLEQLASEVPDNLRQMIGKQLDRLDVAEQELLEAAAVVGSEFSTLAVAAALGQDHEEVERKCERLARSGQFLNASGIGEYPDGSVAARFRFSHALYQSVLYQRIGPARRVRLHQRIGDAGEKVYGKRASEIAAELAMQFEAARDYRAVTYLRQASENAVQRSANREAVGFLTRALDATSVFPEPERTHTEIELLEQRGFVFRAMGEMARAAEDFASAAKHAQMQGDVSSQVRAILYQVSAISWLDHEECLRLADQAVELSSAIDDELLHAHAKGYSGYWHFVLRGWRDEDASAGRDAIRLIRRHNDKTLLALHVSRHSYFESLQGNYVEAIALAEEGARLALEKSDPFEYILAQYFRVWALLCQGQWGELYRTLQAAIQLATSNEHKQWVLLFRLQLMWLYIELGEFEKALELGAIARRATADIHHPLSSMITSILFGHAHLGLRELDTARECFESVRKWLDQERVLMDWIWRIYLDIGEGECALGLRNFQSALDLAEQASKCTRLCGELTWLTRAELLSARAYHELKDEERSATHLQAALQHVNEAPIAAWRVYEFAGRDEEKRRALQTLSNSFEPADQLRESRIFRERPMSHG